MGGFENVPKYKVGIPLPNLSELEVGVVPREGHKGLHDLIVQETKIPSGLHLFYDNEVKRWGYRAMRYGANINAPGRTIVTDPMYNDDPYLYSFYSSNCEPNPTRLIFNELVLHSPHITKVITHEFIKRAVESLSVTTDVRASADMSLKPSS